MYCSFQASQNKAVKSMDQELTQGRGSMYVAQAREYEISRIVDSCRKGLSLGLYLKILQWNFANWSLRY